MILSFSVLDELVPYTWTTFPCTVQKSCSSILFLISNVPTGRRTMSANAFFYPLDEPLGPFSPLQNGKESTDILNLHPNIFIINETSFYEYWDKIDVRLVSLFPCIIMPSLKVAKHEAQALNI